MRYIRLIFACVGVIICSRANSYDDRPIIVLREDDCRITCRDIFPEFGNKSFLDFGKEQNLPITWAVITQQTTQGTALSWSELNDYVSNTTGSELASHSAKHIPMNSLQDYIDDVMLSLSDFKNHTPYPCTTFLQPGNWTGEAYLNSFDRMHNVLGSSIQNNFIQSQEYISGVDCLGGRAYMHGCQANEIDYTPQFVPDNFLKAIDYVSKIPGYIYVIQFHGMQSPTNSLTYHVRTDFMAALVRKLVGLRTDGTIRLLSIHEAYNNNGFSPDINRIYDSSFDLYDADIEPYIMLGMWHPLNGSSIVNQLGRNGSKCGYIVKGSSLRENFSLPSGTYRLSWYQKPANGTALTNKVSTLVSCLNEYGVYWNSVYLPQYSNSTSEWEQKTVLFKAPPQPGRIRFEFTATDNFLVDDVSIKAVNYNPTNEITSLSVTPVPTGMYLTWRSPNDSSFNQIEFRISTSQKCPQTTSEGTLIGKVNASSGALQAIFQPYYWNDKSHVFVSAFAESQGNVSMPAVDFLAVDLAKPTVAIDSLISNSGTINASWTAQMNKSGVYTSSYAVGNTPGAADVVNWSEINDHHAQLLGLSYGKHFYFNVKSQSIYGVWSDVATYSFITEDLELADVFKHPDTDTVQATGVVSGIFNGYYYIQNPNVPRGIKIIGPTSSLSLGMQLNVEGVLNTVDGERLIDTTKK